ncbi:MAG: glycosyltransferase [Puia sp.]|nr:glycosyltransferase [Puia sp.]
MNLFKPYSILHLQLSGIENFVAPEENAYLVFWWNRIPLGHLWIEAGKSSKPSETLAAAIVEELRPALQYYVDRQEGDVDRTALRTFLAAGSFVRLHAFLDENLTVLPGMPGFVRNISLPFPGKAAPFSSDEPVSAPEKLTVVICTRNRPGAIGACIEALLHSADPEFELIVVDNAPDDDSTERVIRSFPSVRYVREPRKGLDIARNTGARLASHALIAYTDDDVVVDPYWTLYLKSCFSDPLVMAVTGLVIPYALQTRSQYIFERNWGFNKGYLPRLFDHRYFLENLESGVRVWDIGAGANMAFRREIFDLVGWFDERLDVGAAGCSGDSELWYRILAEGWNCLYLPHLFVYHHHRETDRELDRQLFSYMRGQVSSLLIQYENYGHKGNLSRLYKGIPKYYFQRIRDRLFAKGRKEAGNIPAELKGCLSGWLYYQRNRHRERFPPSQVPAAMPEKAVVRPDSLVSVIIPCYNQGHYLPEAVESLIAQTHLNMEIIVVDDGSTDTTPLVCRQYKESIRQEGRRFDYIRVERVGLSAARNIGVRCSRGEYIAFLDADDWLYPGGIASNLHYFGVNKGLAFVSGGHDRVDGRGNILPGKEPVEKLTDNFWSLLHGNYIAMEASVLYRREVFFRFHFDPRLKGCEDYDLNLEISRHFPVLGHTAKIAAYRIHGGNMSNNRRMMLEMALRVLKRQEKSLKNESEKEAYAKGVKNWKKYYRYDPGRP